MTHNSARLENRLFCLGTGYTHNSGWWRALLFSNYQSSVTDPFVPPQGRISLRQNASVRIHVGRTIDNPAAVTRNVASPTYAATAKAATLRSHANSPPKSKHHVQPSVNRTVIYQQKTKKTPTTPIKICKLSAFLVNYPLSEYIIIFPRF